jgi:Tfp pilus assembly protein PilN
MRAVNLLPRDLPKAKTREVNLPVVTGFVVGALVVAVLGGGFFHENAKVSHKRTELDAARAELALIPAPVLPDATSTALAGERAKRIAALQAALNGRIAWDRVLREISLVLPGDVWLSGLTLAVPEVTTPIPLPSGSTSEAPPVPATTTEAPTDFTMNGKAFSHQGVARLLSRLALIPDLDNVTLGHSTRVDTGSRDAVEFSVTAGIRVPGAAG